MNNDHIPFDPGATAGLALAAYVQTHGTRVRRKAAMALLCIHDKHVFQKVVDANPDLIHKLPGEGQTKYLTAVIFRLVSARPGSAARCSTKGAGQQSVKAAGRKKTN